MKKLLLLLTTILLLTSCELYYSSPKPTINLISVALDYQASKINPLTVTLSDQTSVIGQVEMLSKQAGYSFNNYRIYNENGKYYNAKGDTLSVNNLKPTIKALFDELSTKISEDDITIFYYSGHGALASSYVLPDDIRGNLAYNGCLAVGYQVDKDNLLTLYELHSGLQKLKGKKIVILDSCHSGYMVKDTINTTNFDELMKYGLNNLFTDNSIDNENIWYLSAALPEQLSYEEKSLGHGIFSYYFLKGLGYDPDSNIATSSSPLAKDGLITLNELYNYTNKGVKGYGASQVTVKGASVLDLVLFNLK